MKHYVPPEQNRAFGLAVCKRLGLDPDVVSEIFHWEVAGGDDLGKIDLTVYLPADEILAMFNQAGRPNG